jgi:hypothetical protein
MEAKFFDSLYSGDSANGVKLCMGLTGGDFWSRPAGVQLLYAGQDSNNVDFGKITAALDMDEDCFEVLPQPPFVQWFYVVRRVNCCGAEEKTLSASVINGIDNFNNLIKQSCNNVFITAVEQIEGDKVLLKWFYQPLHQAKEISGFGIFYDDGTGVIDYQTPIGSLKYAGRRFYRFISDSLPKANYIFCIRAVAADSSDDGFLGQIIIQLNKQNPDGPGLLEYKVI